MRGKHLSMHRVPAYQEEEALEALHRLPFFLHRSWALESRTKQRSKGFDTHVAQLG